MRKLILLTLLLYSCRHEREIESIVLDVPYPATQSLVQGGQCLYGAFLLSDAYLDGYAITPDAIERLRGLPIPNVSDGQRIASDLFGMSVRLDHVRFQDMRDALWSGTPVVLLFRGVKYKYSDAVVLVGLMPEGAILHYPVWSWPGSGAFVFVPWTRFYELFTGWGYVVN